MIMGSEGMNINDGQAKITDYKLICESGEHDLTRQVNNALSDGWIPYGSPVMLPVGTYSHRCAQAMIKIKAPVAGF